MSDTIGAIARVQVTVEIPCSSWGADCTVEQVLKQAGEEAVGRLRRAFDRASGVGDGTIVNEARSWRIVGDPRVVVVLAERERP